MGIAIQEAATFSVIPKFVPFGVLWYTQDTDDLYIGTGASVGPAVIFIAGGAAAGPPSPPLNSIQFNNGGIFGGASVFTWNESAGSAGLGANSTAGKIDGIVAVQNTNYPPAAPHGYSALDISPALFTGPPADNKETAGISVGIAAQGFSLGSPRLFGLLLGVATPSAYTGDAESYTGTYNEVEHNGSGRMNNAIGTETDVWNIGSGTVSAAYGHQILLFNQNNGVISSAAGVSSTVYNHGSGSIGTNYGIYVRTGASNGTITLDYSLAIDSPLTGGTFSYPRAGLYIYDQTSGGALSLSQTYAIQVQKGVVDLGPSGLLMGASAPTAGHVLRSNGTYFLDAQLQFSDIGGTAPAAAWSALTGTLSNGQVIPYGDAGISRLGAASFALGNGTNGDTAGKITGGVFTGPTFIAGTVGFGDDATIWGPGAPTFWISTLRTLVMNGYQMVLNASGSIAFAANINSTSIRDTNISRPAAGVISIDTALAGNSTGNLSFGTIIKYNGVTTVRNGIAAEYAFSDLTAQSAAIGATTLLSAPQTGAYRVSWSATITTASDISSVLGGTNGFQTIYTSPTDSVVKTTVPGNSVTSGANTTATALGGAEVIYAKTGTNIQFSYGYTDSHTSTAMQYELHITVEAL